MSKGYFVTGTDTDAGKTWVSLGLVEKLKQQGNRVGVMKPVSAGCHETDQGLRNDDALQLQAASNLPLDYEQINPYAFAPAIAPHIAAAEIGQRVDIETLYQHFKQIAGQSDTVLVEGAGGWRVPLNDFQSMADLAKRMELPVILVVGMKLGCLNHALLTVDAIRSTRLPLAGWVANQVTPEMDRLDANIATLSEQIDAPLLGHVPYLAEFSAEQIAEQITLPIAAAGLRPHWAI